MDRFNCDLPTPEPVVPEPCRKLALTAAKRLEKELKAHGAKPKAKAAQPVKEPQNAKAKSAAKAKKEDKKQKGKKEDKKNGKRGKASGPMAEAMKAFHQAKKAEGFTYSEAQGLWKTSAERQAIVQTMSDAEKKRRRY